MLKGRKINLLGNKPKTVHDNVDQALKLFIADVASNIYRPEDKTSLAAFTFFDKLKKSNNFLNEFSQFSSISVLNEFNQFLTSLKDELNTENPFDDKFKTLMGQARETANYLRSSFNSLSVSDMQLVQNYIGDYKAEIPDNSPQKAVSEVIQPKPNTRISAPSQASLVRFDLKLPSNFFRDLFESTGQSFTQTESPSIYHVEQVQSANITVNETLKFGFSLADLFENQTPHKFEKTPEISVSDENELEIPQISDQIFGTQQSEIIEEIPGIESITENSIEEELVEENQTDEISVEPDTSLLDIEEETISDTLDEIDEQPVLDSPEVQEETIEDIVADSPMEGLLEDTIEEPAPQQIVEENNFQWLTNSIKQNWNKNFANDKYFAIINTAITDLLANSNPVSAFREVSQNPEYVEFCDFLEVVATNPDFNRDFVSNELEAISNKTYSIFVGILREQTGDMDTTEPIIEEPITAKEETTEELLLDDIETISDDQLNKTATDSVVNEVIEEELVDDFSTPDEVENVVFEADNLSVSDGKLDLLDDGDLTELAEISTQETKPDTEKSLDYFKLTTKIFLDIKQLNSVDLNSSGINQFIDFSLSLKDPIETLREHLEVQDVKDFVEFIDVLHEKHDQNDKSAYQPLIDHQLAIAEQIYQILKDHKEIYGDSEDAEPTYDDNLRLVTPKDELVFDEGHELEIVDQLDNLTSSTQSDTEIIEESISAEISEIQEEISGELLGEESIIEESIEEELIEESADSNESLIEDSEPVIDELSELTELVEEKPNQSSINELDELTELTEEKAEPKPEPVKTAPAKVESAGISKPIERKELNEIQKIFLQEADEYIQKLSNELLLLEKELDNHSLIDSILRSAHTLKGSAGMMKFQNMNKLGHKMEDVFQFLRDNQVAADRELVDIMLRGTDLQQAMLNSLQDNGNDYADGVDKAIHILEEYLKKLEAKKSGEEYKPETFVEKAPVPAVKSDSKDVQPQDTLGGAPAQQQQGNRPVVAEQNLRINISTLNSLINLAAELLISRNRMNNQLGSMEGILGKLQKEKSMLSGILKKFQNLAGKSDIEGITDGILTSEEQGILKDFADTEFDRFSEYDVIIKDLRSNISNFEDVSRDIRELGDAFRQSILSVSQIANELNREIMGMRMVPVKHMFIRFQRSIRDIGREEEKDVDLRVEGEETRLDKTVMEEVIEPIMHCVRNAVSHGIELPAVRSGKGKNPTGMIVLRAFQDGNQVVLEIEDDGAGIDPNKLKQSAINKRLISPERAAAMTDSEAMELMFVPGFSTAEKITTLSGRGVGMDVVKNVVTRFKGSVSVKSNIGKGSKFIIRLPLTLAINQSLLINVGGRIYAFPLSVIEETIDLRLDSIRKIGDQELITVRDQTIPLIHLSNVLSLDEDPSQMKAKYPVIILSDGGQKIGVRVDRLLGKEEIVIKSLGTHLKNVAGVVGATVLGDGSVVLILDVAYLFLYWQGGGNVSQVIRSEISSGIQALDAAVEEATSDAVAPARLQETPKVRTKGKIRILCADDSVSIRKYVASLLSRERFEVTTASDGAEAYDFAERNSYDIIMTDLEMPKMHGYELVSALRSKPSYNHIPIIILTARSGEKHRRRGLELGANAFLNKPFDVDELLNTIDGLLGK